MNIPQQYHQQIKEAWAKVQQPIEYRFYHDGSHEKINDFRDFLNDAVSLNSSMSLKEIVQQGESIRFEIYYRGQSTGISFQGLPLGHELTSFVLAPLVVNQTAQMPDKHTQNRIKSLQGSIDIVSYVSLTCENCPIVVQALNMIASLNPNIKHTMVEGSLFPEEMEKMGIMSVPTVHVNGKDFSTGRQEMSSLLDKLEAQFESVTTTDEKETKEYDVIVVGSGPAGSSAAIYTARKGLKTAIVTENIGGLVRETKGIENLISTPYIEGPELANKIKEHLAEYPIDIFENQRIIATKIEEKKYLTLKGNLNLKAPVLIAATGAKWRELKVPGEKEYLGKGVAYCPHCDGPFFKNKEIAVVGGGNSGVEAALDLANICSKVTILERSSKVKADQILVEKLNERSNIEILYNAQTKAIKGNGSTVSSLNYVDQESGESKKLPLSGVFIQIGLVPNSQWLEDSVATTSYGEIIVNEKNETNEKGIFAAGDVSTVPYKQIVVAMGEGAKAGLSAFEYLLKAG